MNFGSGNNFTNSLNQGQGQRPVYPEETKAAARITVCHFATDAPEAIEFMKMLGIHPTQGDEEFNAI